MGFLYKGDGQLKGNLSVLSKKPLDSRSVVQNASELLTIDSKYAYDGMLVVSIDDGAVYILVDKDNISNLTGWKRIGTVIVEGNEIDLSSFVTASEVTASVNSAKEQILSEVDERLEGFSPSDNGEYLPLEGGALGGDLRLKNSSIVFTDSENEEIVGSINVSVIDNDINIESEGAVNINTGRGLCSNNNIEASGFVRPGFNNDYVLLAGGGVKLLSELGIENSEDWSSSEMLGNYLPLTGGTMRGTLSFRATNNTTYTFIKGGEDSFVLETEHDIIIKNSNKSNQKSFISEIPIVRDGYTNDYVLLAGGGVKKISALGIGGSGTGTGTGNYDGDSITVTNVILQNKDTSYYNELSADPEGLYINTDGYLQLYSDKKIQALSDVEVGTIEEHKNLTVRGNASLLGQVFIGESLTMSWDEGTEDDLETKNLTISEGVINIDDGTIIDKNKVSSGQIISSQIINPDYSNSYFLLAGGGVLHTQELTDEIKSSVLDDIVIGENGVTLAVDNTLTETSSNPVKSSGIYSGVKSMIDNKFVVLSEAEYNAMESHDANTFYYITK